MEYRPLPEDREQQFQDYVQYAFSPESGPQEDHDWEIAEQPGDARGLFDGDDILAVCSQYWFRARVRGRWTEMPGLSAVASPPEHRRKGNVVRLLESSLDEYRERGDFLTALWAFEHPFYERQGWGLANKYVQYECPPEVLGFARQHASGEFRRVEGDDYAALDSVLAAHAERFELEIDRTEKWWRKRVFESYETDPYGYVWTDEEGEIRGYVVYYVEDENDGNDGRRLDVEELAFADREAYLNLLRFLANHDSQVGTVSIRGPPDTTLLDEVADPAEVECEVKPGPMVRLVDVPAGIEALKYPDADGEFTLSVSDSLADWNDRRFRISVEGGRATCEPIDASADSDIGPGSDINSSTNPASDTNLSPDPDAEVGIATLSQLYVGYHSVEDAETFGSLEIRSPAARETLAAMFPPREVFLREGF